VASGVLLDASVRSRQRPDKPVAAAIDVASRPNGGLRFDGRFVSASVLSANRIAHAAMTSINLADKLSTFSEHW
jgi:hypothetical protein